ncbi:pyridoxamine 5'-phosphate oxidase family protein [Acidaminobacter hydrogenoformans]|uniref:Pyridoxamine 5'-phosphate oxidase n=1 Tax=Acidaminobacter hydrogenoformans DSM 2784 TaxID=1120920 RepID=A0A1G5S1K4_9FIRM|nr:pyridoxamine 5'-phosphate oxidase family protein [Acidaminobacter hydrogenoformans]SCZ79800.1 Pyridoxamine 5'-phosphate oxidase [Acidaminobacter hydrogenoformans DSM 2784]
MHDMVEAMLRSNTLCVLCTESKAMPHCSLMTYLLGEDGKTLYLTTSTNSRKYRNLKENENVSLLIDSRQILEPGSVEPVCSVTFEGVYFEIGDGHRTEEIRMQFQAQHPELEQILSSESCRIIGVRLHAYLLLNGPVQELQGKI